MQVLLLSSKYYPEYSGSGLRAHNTYMRLSEKYDVQFDVLCNSLSFNGNKKYNYQGVIIYRIKSPLNKSHKESFFYKITQGLDIMWQVFFTLYFLILNHNRYKILHTFGDTWSIGIATVYFSLFNKPIIRELCNDTNFPMYPIQFHSLISKIFKKKQTLIIAISKRLSDNALKFKPHKVWLRNNPVDEKKIFY